MVWKTLSCIFLVSVVAVFSAYAGEVKLTTYYPAPYGEYKKTVTKTLGVGDTNKDGIFNGSDAPDPATNPGDVKIAGNLYLPDVVRDPTSFGPKTGALITGGGIFHTYRAIGAAGYNVFIGGAGNCSMGIDAINNNIIGPWAFTSNTSGHDNNAMGTGVLRENSTGYENVAIGPWALAHNTSGHNNIAIGAMALTTNSTGDDNIAIGLDALVYSTADRNNAIGFYALRDNTTGTDNTAIGAQALTANTTGFNNNAVGFNAIGSNTTGHDNVGIGIIALNSNTTGSYNTAIGSQVINSLTTGSNNTALGYYTGVGITTGSNNTVVGANVTGLDADLSNNVIIADGSGNQRIRVDSTGRVGIGTTTPAGALVVQSTTGGFIPPKMTTAQKTALTPNPRPAPDPLLGSVVYDTTQNALNLFTGQGWQPLSIGEIFKSGDFSTILSSNSSATFTDVPFLDCTVGPNEIWMVECRLVGSEDNGARIAFSSDSSTTYGSVTAQLSPYPNGTAFEDHTNNTCIQSYSNTAAVFSFNFGGTNTWTYVFIGNIVIRNTDPTNSHTFSIKFKSASNNSNHYVYLYGTSRARVRKVGNTT